MKSDDIIGFLIKKINTIYETKINHELMNLQLTRTQLDLLIYIDIQLEKGLEVNQKDIEMEFQLKNPTVTGILNRLEEKSFIKRTISNKNARYKKIIITQQAKEMLKPGREKSKIIEKKVNEALTKEEKKQLNLLLNKLYVIIAEGEDEK